MVRLFIVLLYSVSIGLSAQTVSYNIKIFGDNIGRMDVTRTIDKDGNEVYTAVSKSKAKILWMNIENLSEATATYKNGKLISTVHREVENGKVKRHTKVTWDGKVYKVEALNKPIRTFTTAPECCDIKVYFTDVRTIKSMFLVGDANPATLKTAAPDKIEYKNAEGNKTIFFLENGQVKNSEFHLSLATVYMQRIG